MTSGLSPARAESYQARILQEKNFRPTTTIQIVLTRRVHEVYDPSHKTREFPYVRLFAEREVSDPFVFNEAVG